MSGVPNVFGSATSSIPLSQLDVNFNTPVTIGNTTVGLGNTVTSFGNVTLTNTTISGLSGGSANGVVYINSSNVAVASPAVLAFDGTNLGVGVTPSAWGGFKALQVGASASIYSTGGSSVFGVNTYNDGTNSRYLTTNPAGAIGFVGGQWQWSTAPSGTAGNAITFTQAMTLDGSGDLLVGNTANIYGSRLNVKSNGDNVAAEFYRQGAVSGSGIVVFSSNSGGTETLKSYIDAVSGLLVASSDERLKENIVPLNYGLQQITSLRPVSFEWKQGDGNTNLGFIAQEVEMVLPEAVKTLDKSMSKTIDNQKMLNNDFIVPVLVKAIQELSAQVTTLQSQVTALQTKVGV